MKVGLSLAVQWLKLCPSNAGGAGLIPGGGTKIPRVLWCSQKKKKRDVRWKLSTYKDIVYNEFNPIYKVCCVGTWGGISNKGRWTIREVLMGKTLYWNILRKETGDFKYVELV